MARDIFVSYSQPDRDCAFALTRHLEASGFTVWIAPRDISPAAEWAAEIIDAISAARAMVLVFSASSNSSAQVRREVERAVHKDVPILPFRIEDVLPSRSLEYFLSSHQWLDGFPSPREPHYERLCGCLREWLPETSGQPAPPERPASIEPPLAAAARAGAVIHGMHVSHEQLRELETRLARIMGPIAGILVHRAAAAAESFTDLERRLAAELDSPEDRRRFLQVH